MHKVEKELLKATKIEPRDIDNDETFEDYLERLMNAVNMLDDDGWNALSPAAQTWQNEAAEAHKADKDIPGFEEDKPAKAAKATAKAPAKAKPAKAAEPEEEDEPEEDEDEVADAKPAKRARAASDEAEVENGENKPAKPKRTRQVGKTGMSAVAFARQHLATHPGCTVEDMAAAIKKAGYATPLSNMTLNSLRNDFRAWSRIFTEQNFLKRGVDLGV